MSTARPCWPESGPPVRRSSRGSSPSSRPRRSRHLTRLHLHSLSPQSSLRCRLDPRGWPKKPGRLPSAATRFARRSSGLGWHTGREPAKTGFERPRPAPRSRTWRFACGRPCSYRRESPASGPMPSSPCWTGPPANSGRPRDGCCTTCRTSVWTTNARSSGSSPWAGSRRWAAVRSATPCPTFAK